MATQQTNVRYPDWMKKAVTDFAKKNGFSNESRAFIWLLSSQLNRYGYLEENYTVMVDKPLHEEIANPSSTVSNNEGAAKKPASLKESKTA